MPTFAPVKFSPAGQMNGLAVQTWHRTQRRRRQMAYLSGLGQDISPIAMDEDTYGGAPPSPPAPGLPVGWDTSTPSPAPPVVFSPSVQPAGPITVVTGALLTYTVNYNLDASNLLTSNADAVAAAASVLAAVGLAVVNTSLPSSINPFSSNSAILTVQVTGAGFANAQAVKALCDNAFVNVGAQIISSSIAMGAGNSMLNWIMQNWQMVAVGAIAVMILPKILDDFI